MSDQQRDHDQDDRPVPAPTGTGGGGGEGEDTARPIPADHQEGTQGASGGNAPDDGSSPGDVDRDSQPNRHGDAAEGVGPDGRPEGEGPASTPADVNKTTGGDEDSAADADGASAAAAEAGAETEAAEPEPDWKDRYVRSVAELDNVRRRARRDAAMGEARGIAKLAKELLPALDNLDRALAHVDADPANAGDGQLVEGLRIVHREIHAALSQAGIEAYDPTGQPFDPHAHEALTQQPAPEGTPEGTILAVYQAGYRRGDDVLRAAKVVVAG